MSTTIPDSLHARAQSGVMNDTTDPDPEVPERARGRRRYSAKYKAQIPLGRYATTDEVASVVEWIASDGAAYVTGAVIPVDGGLGMGH